MSQVIIGALAVACLVFLMLWLWARKQAAPLTQEGIERAVRKSFEGELQSFLTGVEAATGRYADIVAAEELVQLYDNNPERLESVTREVQLRMITAQRRRADTLLQQLENVHSQLEVLPPTGSTVMGFMAGSKQASRDTLIQQEERLNFELSIVLTRLEAFVQQYGAGTS